MQWIFRKFKRSKQRACTYRMNLKLCKILQKRDASYLDSRNSSSYYKDKIIFTFHQPRVINQQSEHKQQTYKIKSLNAFLLAKWINTSGISCLQGHEKIFTVEISDESEFSKVFLAGRLSEYDLYNIGWFWWWLIPFCRSLTR